jgi:hypothetical protein
MDIKPVEQDWMKICEYTHGHVRFYPSKADPNAWMKDCGTSNNFACTYVEDLTCCEMKQPNIFFQELRHHGYKLKGVGEIAYQLGEDFFRDPNGTVTWRSKTYVKCILNQCPSRA